MSRHYVFYVYILSNPSRSVLYIGFTENLERRLQEHIANKRTNSSFAGKYNCTDLIYYETYKYVNEAIAREKQLKRWSRVKKDNLILNSYPKQLSLNGNFITET